MIVKKDSLNFELNLVPMIDVFSACICFLLLTVVWVQIGMMQVNQGVGTKQTHQPPTVVVSMNGDGSFHVSYENVQGFYGKSRLQALEQLKAVIKPNVKTAIVMPHANSRYQQVLDVMDEFRRLGMKDVGITPL